MSEVVISAICNKCQTKFPTMWIGRDIRGFPTLEGLICGVCGGKNCVRRDWSGQEVNAIIPPIEDGNVNRFEFSYKNEDGKTISKKMDPHEVKKHYRNNMKG